MTLFNQILNKETKISVVGLGYVGLQLAIAFSKVAEVIGFDISKERIFKYIHGVDVTNEVGNEVLVNSTVLFTSEEKYLFECKFHVIAVPTPVNQDKTPDLEPLISASRSVGKNLVKGSMVVYESTVYPGVTEDICIPILEMESGLRCGIDFKVGYSPERINPGDREHTLELVIKIVSGMDEEALETISQIYELIIEAGVYRAESIKVAEAAKVIENSQRDINIAFMNELSIILNKMDINTHAVLNAAATKWNFLKFSPGLVGGHCIGVDPYYLTHKAEKMGYHSNVILAGRKVNDSMGKYVAENTVKTMIKAKKQIYGSKVAVFGITFKENCPDVRNTKVIDIINELYEYGMEVKVVDPIANKDELWNEYKIKLYKIEELIGIEAIIIAVPHKEFQTIDLKRLKNLYDIPVSVLIGSEVAVAREDSIYTDKNNVLIDVKGIFKNEDAEREGFFYWSL